MIFNLKKKIDGEICIIDNHKMIKKYKLLEKINNLYGDYNKIYQYMNFYEFLYPYLLRQTEESYYKYYYDYFIYNNKYNIKYVYLNDNKYISLLKYNPIDKYFTSYIELFIKYKNRFNISNNTKILEISNTTFSCEAINYLYNNISVDLFLCETNDKELLDRLSIIQRIFNKKFNTLEHLNNFNNKYYIILL